MELKTSLFPRKGFDQKTPKNFYIQNKNKQNKKKTEGSGVNYLYIYNTILSIEELIITLFSESCSCWHKTILFLQILRPLILIFWASMGKGNVIDFSQFSKNSVV